MIGKKKLVGVTRAPRPLEGYRSRGIAGSRRKVGGARCGHQSRGGGIRVVGDYMVMWEGKGCQVLALGSVEGDQSEGPWSHARGVGEPDAGTEARGREIGDEEWRGRAEPGSQCGRGN